MPNLAELLGQVRDTNTGDTGLKQLMLQQAHTQGAMDQEKQKQALGMQNIQQLQKTTPGAAVKAGDVSVTPKPDPEIKQAMRDQEKMPYHIAKITSDYRKTVGDLDSRLSAARSVSDALKQNDIQTLGQLKAQLPRLEGERFRPTDTERKVMLQPTFANSAERLKNFFAGDDAAISDNQRAAILKIVDTKVSEANKDLQRARREVMSRWKGHVRGMTPDDFENLANSLGSTSEELLQDMQSSPASKENPKHAKPTSMSSAPMSFQDWKAQKAKQGR